MQTEVSVECLERMAFLLRNISCEASKLEIHLHEAARLIESIAEPAARGEVVAFYTDLPDREFHLTLTQPKRGDPLCTNRSSEENEPVTPTGNASL